MSGHMRHLRESLEKASGSQSEFIDKKEALGWIEFLLQRDEELQDNQKNLFLEILRLKKELGDLKHATTKDYLHLESVCDYHAADIQALDRRVEGKDYAGGLWGKIARTHEKKGD